MSAPDTEKLLRPVEELFSERNRLEQESIVQRMTWIMTLNGFLVGGTSVVIANRDKLGGNHTFAGALLVIATLGSLSNISCLFSNVWASRSIREARDVVGELSELPPDEKQLRLGRMRLYGADPRSFTHPTRPTPSHVLHPWILLPFAFAFLFVLLGPMSAVLSSQDTRLPVILDFALLAVLTPFPVFILLDRHHHKSGTTTSPPEPPPGG